jgi:hypothetical protein
MGSNGMITDTADVTDTAADEQLLAELAESDFDTDSNVVEVIDISKLLFDTQHTHILRSM